jgi:hypothetical protein
MPEKFSYRAFRTITVDDRPEAALKRMKVYESCSPPGDPGAYLRKRVAANGARIA